MRPPLLLALALLLAAGSARAQTAPGTAPGGPQSNFVDRLLAVGDTLWAGPRLVFTPDGGQTWTRARGEDQGVPDVFAPPQAPNAAVYALAGRGDLLWAGLGFRDPSPPGFVQSAAGFAVSEDGGRTWRYRFPQLDTPEDRTQRYGVSLLPALPVVAPQLAAPFSLAIDPATRDLWVAGTLSGARRLRYDAEAGAYARRFERVVLPPDTLLAIRPEEPQTFPVGPPVPGLLDFSTNSVAYAVLIDEAGTGWVGTEAGLNRSTPDDVVRFEDDAGRTFDERAWRRTPFDGTVSGLVGRAVIALAEQRLGDLAFPVGSPENPRNPVWVASWTPVIQGIRTEPGERAGVAVTRDGGESFEPVLVGERVYGFAFCEAAHLHCEEGTVWAAAEDGLFASADGGQTWAAARDFRDRDRPGRFVKPGAQPRAVAATREALWVGTTDGLLKSTDGGQTWAIFRTDVPVRPAEPTARTPEVEAYAYPNPFSPRTDRVVRIRYERAASRIRILDFGMNLVRTLDAPAPDEQAWDGLDDGGARVANGVYFYAVDAPGETLWGKILVLE